MLNLGVYEKEDVMQDIMVIINEYGDLLTDTQKQAIYNYYKQAYYSSAKDYLEIDKKLAREHIQKQIKFLENESWDGKRYKVKLIDKLGFDTWLSWIFGKIILDIKPTTTDISCVCGFVKDYFIKRRIRDLASVLGNITIIEE